MKALQGKKPHRNGGCFLAVLFTAFFAGPVLFASLLPARALSESGSGMEGSCAMPMEPAVQPGLDRLESEYGVELSRYKCVIVNADTEDDISEIINHQDGDTVVILRQQSPHRPFIARNIAYLKPGMWLLGVNETESEPVTIQMVDDKQFSRRALAGSGQKSPESC